MNHPIYSGFMNPNPMNHNGSCNSYNLRNYNGYNNNTRVLNNNSNGMQYNYRGDIKNYYGPYNNNPNISPLGIFREPVDSNCNYNGNYCNYNGDQNFNSNFNGNSNFNSTQNGNMNANIITQSRNNGFSQTPYGNINSNYNAINGNINNFQSQKGNEINSGVSHQNNYNNNNYFDYNTNSNWRRNNTPFRMNIKCRRCEQYGHKAFVCPYSMEEIKKLKEEHNTKPDLIKNNVQNPNPNEPLNSN